MAIVHAGLYCIPVSRVRRPFPSHRYFFVTVCLLPERVKLTDPDLCDDSVDRVIDGVHFGKKWKHYVRNAQQYLKRSGEIEFDGSRWRLCSPA
jgi:hypothetical protein